eukprot:Skav235011  [mRNA]  locus=scaffold276:149845:154186:+ [translate_table: standard]
MALMVAQQGPDTPRLRHAMAPQESEQAAVVLAIFVALAVGTWTLVGPIFQFLQQLLPEGWCLGMAPGKLPVGTSRGTGFKGWQKTWPILGAFYMAAGVAHFTAQDAFESIYPPEGTWGFWYLPGSASFHVAWTGVAEIAGGTGLFVGALLLGLAGALQMEVPSILRQIPSLSALGLFGLTWAVTPANAVAPRGEAKLVSAGGQTWEMVGSQGMPW